MNRTEQQPSQQQPLTHVELIWIEQKIEHWLRFGRPVEKKILDRRRSVSSFKPGSIFGFVRWASNDYGTVVSHLDIVRATSPGEYFQTLPCVSPGGEILLRADNWPTVECVQQEIDAIEALRIDPADVAPDYCANSTTASLPATRPAATPASNMQLG